MSESSISQKTGPVLKKELAIVHMMVSYRTASLQQKAAWNKLWMKLISDVNSNEPLNLKYDDKEQKNNE